MAGDNAESAGEEVGRLVGLLATASPSPSDGPLVDDGTHATLVLLAVGAIAFLFVLAVAATLRGKHTNL